MITYTRGLKVADVFNIKTGIGIASKKVSREDSIIFIWLMKNGTRIDRCSVSSEGNSMLSTKKSHEAMV